MTELTSLAYDALLSMKGVTEMRNPETKKNWRRKNETNQDSQSQPVLVLNKALFEVLEDGLSKA